MGTSRSLTERQLQEAKQALTAHASTLEADGVARAQMKRNPRWRHLDAKARQISQRLKRIGATEALNAEVIRLREAKLAAAAAEAVAEPEPAPAPEPEAKPKKAKKKKPAEE